MGTKTCCIIFKPDKSDQVDCYVGAEFGGLNSVEDGQETISVKSRTEYVILFSGVPILSVSKMQTHIALSTMEAEYIVLSQSMHDLNPISEILKEIKRRVFLTDDYTPYCASHSKAFKEVLPGNGGAGAPPQSTVYEDNEACLKFAIMPKLSPRTKHIGVPFHWFRSRIVSLEITVCPLESSSQLADQLTIGLPLDAFLNGRKAIMQW
jgi:hypothetical protein